MSEIMQIALNKRICMISVALYTSY